MPEERLSALVAIRRGVDAVQAGRDEPPEGRLDTIQDFVDMLDLLERFEVRYLIIGGLAFTYHANPSPRP